MRLSPLLFFTFFSIIVFAQEKLIVNEEGTPPLEFFGPDDYKGFNQVWDVIQDDRGLLYITTTNSINEYDGTDWRRIPLPQSNSLGRCFTKSNSGTIYLGGINLMGYLGTDSIGMTTFISLQNLLPDSVNIGMIEFVKSLENKVYFAGRESIHVYDQINQQITSFDTGVKSYPNFLFENKMCFNLAGKGFFTVAGDSLQLITDQFKEISVSDVISVGTGNALYVVSPTDGLFYFSKDTSYQVAGQINEVIKNKFAYKVLPIFKDYFAFSLLKGGMMVTDHEWQPILKLSKEDGIDNQVFKTFLDKDYNLWIASNTGLVKAELASSRSDIGESNGISGAHLDIKLVEDTLFVATAEGIFFKAWNTSYDKFDLVNTRFQKVKNVGIYNYNMLPTKDGLLVKAYESIGWLIKGRYKTLLERTSQRAGFAFYGDSTLSLTTGTNGSQIELFGYQNDQWKHLQTISNKILPEMVFFLVYDPQNQWVWGANPNQLFRFRLSKDYDEIIDFKAYGIDDGLPDDSRNWFQVIDGGVVFVTRQGLFRFDSDLKRFIKDERFNNYFKDKGLQRLTQIPGQSSKYFYSTNNGQRGIYDTEAHQAEFKMTVFSTMTQSLYYGKLGGLLGSDILHFYQADKKEVYGFEFKPLIRRIENISLKDSSIFNGQYMDYNQSVVLPSDQNSIRVSFSIPYYRHPEKILYQYRLSGFDSSWSTWSSKTEKEYTNLPFGNYIFEVKAKNAFGTVSASGQFAIAVNRPWFFSWWAIGGYLLLFILLVAGIVRLNTRRLKRENLRLENVVEERTREIKDQRDVIEKSLLERESLLKEIHHRVKNNLQIIASLLYLQSGKFEDENFKRVLEEGQGRVRSMALIHQKLYENDDLKSIPFEEYLMELVGEIRASFGNEMGKVKLNIDAHEIYFDVEVAIPLGLIVNELATNAFKYAFDQKEKGSFSIFLKKVDENYLLSVQDDGKGIPDEVDIRKTKSLGLRLVRMLSQQLEGDFEFSGQNGTRFELKFAA